MYKDIIYVYNNIHVLNYAKQVLYLHTTCVTTNKPRESELNHSIYVNSMKFRKFKKCLCLLHFNLFYFNNC